MKNTKREGVPLLGASLLALENAAVYQEQSIMSIKAGADFIHFDAVGPHNSEATAITHYAVLAKMSSWAFLPKICIYKKVVKIKGFRSPL